jgi:HPt (histidine-containing phosphotransfer) domain-containing protein
MAIDLTRFEELSEGDPSSLLELINLYLDKTSEQIKELDQAITSGASANVARIAHSMVGASAMVGMDILIQPLRTLEGYGEKGDFAQSRVVFAGISQSFQTIKDHLQKTAATLSRP